MCCHYVCVEWCLIHSLKTLVCVMFMCRPSVCVVSRYVDTLYADYLLAFVLCRCCIDTL